MCCHDDDEENLVCEECGGTEEVMPLDGGNVCLTCAMKDCEPSPCPFCGELVTGDEFDKEHSQGECG